MTLEEKKERLLTYYKDTPEKLTASISEFMFDITDIAHCSKYRQRIIDEEDSRNVWLTFLDWAWEFQYDWTFNPEVDDTDYYGFVDTLAMKKLDETYGERTYTVVYQMTGRVEVKASSAAEARMLSGGMEIEWDDYGGEIINVIEED